MITDDGSESFAAVASGQQVLKISLADSSQVLSPLSKQPVGNPDVEYYEVDVALSAAADYAHDAAGFLIWDKCRADEDDLYFDYGYTGGPITLGGSPMLGGVVFWVQSGPSSARLKLLGYNEGQQQPWWHDEGMNRDWAPGQREHLLVRFNNVLGTVSYYPGEYERGQLDWPPIYEFARMHPEDQHGDRQYRRDVVLYVTDNPGMQSYWDELKYHTDSDCDADGLPDSVYLAGDGWTGEYHYPGYDANGNEVLDWCEDCQSNGIRDDAELAAGTSTDCNANGIPDECDIDPQLPVYNQCGSPATGPEGPSTDHFRHVWGMEPDCANGLYTPYARHGGGVYDGNGNGVPDDCEADCNGNGLIDACDTDCAAPECTNPPVGVCGESEDVNSNGIPDECEPDCDDNGTPDEYELAGNDCNGNGFLDVCDLAAGSSQDMNSSGMPDECELAGNDCNGNLLPDDLDLGGNDCNMNSIPDDCEFAVGDCNSNGRQDGCELICDPELDCNENGVLDDCDLAAGSAKDCNSNWVPDSCDVASGAVPDCNANGFPDECDVAFGTSSDCNLSGIPDECEVNVGPIITSQPTGQTACAGDSAVFSVEATGVGELHYHWSMLVEYPPQPVGVDSPVLQVENACAELDGAEFYVRVSDDCGSRYSAAAILIVRPLPSPEITAEPAGPWCEGMVVTLDAGGPYVQYTWTPGEEYTQQIEVNQTGEYCATVMNQFGCTETNCVDVVFESCSASLTAAYSVADHGGQEFELPINLSDGLIEPRSQGEGDIRLRLEFDAEVAAENYEVAITPDPGVPYSLVGGQEPNELVLEFSAAVPDGGYTVAVGEDGFPLCFVRGDANCSGQTEGLDLALISNPAYWQASVTQEVLTAIRCDANRSGEVEGLDLALISNPAVWQTPAEAVSECSCPGE